MKNLGRHLSVIHLFILSLFAVSCTEEVDTSARYVFTERTIASYLDDHQQFSEYVRLLKEQKVSDVSETSVYQLMTAYGYYTCFAPTNEAIQLYLDSLVIKRVIPEANWDAFPDERSRDSIRAVIVLNSILDGTKQMKTFYSADFPKTNEEFEINTMADRKISVTYYKQDPDSLSIDGICPVSKNNRDIEAINGFIHQVSYVINPSNETLGSTLHKFSSDYESNLSVMARMVEICGLVDTLTKVRDERYEKLYKSWGFSRFQLAAAQLANPPTRASQVRLYVLCRDRRILGGDAWQRPQGYHQGRCRELGG